MKPTLLAPHEQRLAAGVTVAQRALFRADAGCLPMREFELREVQDGTGGTKLRFTGYASVTEQGYPITDWLGTYEENVRRGAFGATLAQDPDVMFLLNHGGMTMARTKSGSLRLTEDDTGLLADADLNPRRGDINDLRIAIDDHDIDEMSFAFRVTRQDWSPDYAQRDILEVDINGGDVSTVNKGANPHTGGLVALRSLVSPRALRSITTGLRKGDLTSAQSTTLERILRALAADEVHLDLSPDELDELDPAPLDERAPDPAADAAVAEAAALLAADLHEVDRVRG